MTKRLIKGFSKENEHFLEYKEFNCQNINSVFHYTNVVLVIEFKNGTTVRLDKPDYVSLVEPRLW